MWKDGKRKTRISRCGFLEIGLLLFA